MRLLKGVAFTCIVVCWCRYIIIYIFWCMHNATAPILCVQAKGETEHEREREKRKLHFLNREMYNGSDPAAIEFSILFHCSCVGPRELKFSVGAVFPLVLHCNEGKYRFFSLNSHSCL